MIVVMPGHDGEELVDRPASTRIEVNPAAVPISVGKRRKERERFVTPPPERYERCERVVPKVLPLRRPSIGIVPRKRRLRHFEDEAAPREKPLFGIPKMTDHFDGRPRARRGPTRETVGGGVLDRRLQLLRGEREPAKPETARLRRVVFNACHGRMRRRRRSGGGGGPGGGGGG